MDKALFVDANALLYVVLHGNRKPRMPCPEDQVPLSRFITWMGDLVRGPNKPEYMAVPFDPPGNNWRNDLFADYKAHRGSKDDRFGVLRIAACKYLRGLGIASGVVPGFEADDALAALCKAMPKDVHSVVLTGDKDLYQLASKRVSLMDLLGDVRGVERSTRAMGVPPKLIPDYLALAGDTADNIPGAKGIGTVHARLLLKQFPGGLEDIIKNRNILPTAIARSLGNPDLLMYKRLTSLDTTAPISAYIRPNPEGTYRLPEKLNWDWAYEFCMKRGIKTRRPK